MFARVTSAEGDVDRTAEVVREQVLPAAHEIDGFLGLVTLGDRRAGKGFTITFWRDEAAMRQSEERANQIRQAAIEEIGASRPTVEQYEVTVAELPTATRA